MALNAPHLLVPGFYQALYDNKTNTIWNRAEAHQANCNLTTQNAIREATAKNESISIHIRQIRDEMVHIVGAAQSFYRIVQAQGVNATELEVLLEVELANIVDYLQETFPSPDAAPGHEDRLKLIYAIVEKLEDAMVIILHGHFEMDEDQVRTIFRQVSIPLSKMVGMISKCTFQNTSLIPRRPC